MGRPVTEPVRPFRLDGTELAGYLIHSLVGWGGRAYVYRADDRSLGRTVALKVLAPDLADNADFRRRFLWESQLAASLDHPNVLPIYDAGETNGILYIAMRFVEGRNLREVLGDGRQLEIPTVLGIVSQVADALDAAHAHGLVHKDVKPANILISAAADGDGHDHVYVSDFGVTTWSAAPPDPAKPGPFAGPIDYLAPEQIRDEPVSVHTDVYALGCVVYECLTGTVPFARDDDGAVLRAHLDEEAPPISRLRPDLPSAVAGIMARAMAKNPADRYHTCGAFVGELLEALRVLEVRARETRSEAPSLAAPPAPELAAQPQPPRIRRRRLTVAILAGVVAVAAAVFGYEATSDKRFTGTAQIPMTFRYPAHWRPAGTGPELVLSPRPAEFLPLFTAPGGDNWSAAREILRDDPSSAVGVAIAVVPTDDAAKPIEQQREVLRLRLPDDFRFIGEPSAVVLGNSPAHRHDAELTDPADNTVRLTLQCYIALIPNPEPHTVYVMFFSSAKWISYHRTTLDNIVGSVKLPD